MARAVADGGSSAPIFDLQPRQLFAIATILAALLFGLAGLVGAIGYMVSVTRSR